MNRPIALVVLALLLPLALATEARAAVPGTLAVHGTIQAQGGVAPDGKYVATFAIYAVESGGASAWTEGLTPIEVKGGRFVHILGLSKPLTASVLSSLKEAWLGVAIDLAAEQPRVRLHTVAYAVQAATAAALDCSGCVQAAHIGQGAISAEKVGFAFAGAKTKGGPASLALDLQCTGCVSLSELKIDGDLDLGGNALKTKTLSATSVSAQTVSAASFVGDGSKLTGIKTPAGACKVKGEVVNGINPDGSLSCVPGGGAGGLPPDGIDEVSNGLIFNQFVDSAASKGPVPIPDNNPIGVSDTIEFPDVGLAQKLTVYIDVDNSDLSAVELTLYDPNNQKYLLLAKGVGKGSKLKTSFPDLSKTASGDLTTWVGKNPKGKWQLKVTDEAFKNNQFDGAVQSWRIDIQTLSSKKIQVKGDLIVDGSVQGSKGFNIVGDTNFNGKVQYNDSVVFKKSVIIEGGIAFGDIKKQSFDICADPAPNGPCVAELFAGRGFLAAAQHCASLKGDICTDSQSYVMRKISNGSTIYNFKLLPNWTNSFADNDGGQWSEVNGGTGDDHSASSPYLVPCCHNITPPVPGEQKIAGIRVLKINNAENATWDVAVNACMALRADLCDKGQYRVMRNNGKISARMWASDHSDNDGTNYGMGQGKVSDNPNPNQQYGYACCATNRDKLECPAGATDIEGVCVAKIHNGNVNWSTAATACSSLGTRVCSVAQSAVLRKAGKVTSAASWTASYSDNDGGNPSVGVGNAGDDHNSSSGYGYGCCY